LTLHYHGTPISPTSELQTLAGRCLCVPYSDPRDVERAHQIGQSVMLDNGAFSFWRKGLNVVEYAGPEWWDAYYDWAEPWLDYQTTWAVIPDVIGGTEDENDLLLVKWYKRRLPRGAPVWHMHESLDRLKRLANGYERVCIGSSAQYATVGSSSWHRRMEEAMNKVCATGPPPVWIHMLRGMAVVDAGYPFASVDSTDLARNGWRPQNTLTEMAARWDAKQAPARWTMRTQLTMMR
jgi:hypothetical protein